MRQSYKVLINTGSLYIKIIVNAVVTLVSTRIVLQELGIDSYGLYNLIAGVITLLAFFNGALMVSSQRFLSIAMGEKDNLKLANVFKISFLVHLFLGVIIAVILIALQPFIFSGFLNIEPEMVGVAKKVFGVMIISSFVTIVAIPYNAALNAREELWFFSISETIVSLLKLGAAVYLLYTTSDLLLTYTILMLIAIVLGGLIKYIWCVWRYPECRIKLKGSIDKYLFREMFAFAGWNTLGSLAVVVRNQGIAVVLNIFFGTVVNAAYGVANQLNALVITFAGTLTTVFTPMIVKAKGEDNNEKMLFVSIFSSKMSFFLSSIIALPVLVFTPFILNIWLKNVPEHTVEFCQTIILSFLVMQLYPGITRALYAEGSIKWYQIVISIILISNLPIGYFLFYMQYPPSAIFVSMVVLQVITMFATTYFAKKKVNLNVKEFYIVSILYPTLLMSGVFLLMNFAKLINIKNAYLECVLISLLGLTIYVVGYYLFVLKKNEKLLLINLLKSLRSKLHK